MIFLRHFLTYVFGYVSIAIEGFFVERFINICISKGIFLSKMRREKSTILHANISIKDFKKIREIAKKTKCKIKIESKRGIPFLAKKYKKRKIFGLFLIIIIISIFLVSRFIWNIEVIGDSTISKEEILDNLKELGLDIGKLKSRVDTKEIIREIRLKRDDISWIGIDIKGTNAIVEVVDTAKKPEIVNKDEFCNIISDEDGMIMKISVQNGTAAVKEGDIVKKGSVLVNGFLEGKYTGIRYVHATADIEAKVWYSEKAKVSIIQEENLRTGKEEKKYGIKINNFKINFYKTLSKFKNYDTIEEEKKLTLFSNYYLPIKIVKSTNYETEKQEVIYDVEELKEKVVKQLEEKIEGRIEKEKILNKQINSKEEENFIEVEVIYEVRQNIGTKEKIVF